MRSFRLFNWHKHGPHVTLAEPYRDNTIVVGFGTYRKPKVFGPYLTDRNLIRDITFLRKELWRYSPKKKSLLRRFIKWINDKRRV